MKKEIYIKRNNYHTVFFGYTKEAKDFCLIKCKGGWRQLYTTNVYKGYFNFLDEVVGIGKYYLK